MDELALQFTDKSSLFHDYMKIHSLYFFKIRNERLKFLEIGIYKGGSLVVWENYFPNAEIHGVDNTLGYLCYPLKKAICHVADQENSEDLLRVVEECKRGDFDIILDDGGHKMDQ